MSLEINIDVNEYYELRNLDASVYSPLRRLVNKENFLSILNEYKLTSELQSMNSINYKQFLPHINGIISLDAAFNDAFDATKQLIKTQLNWMKKFELNYYANTEDINDSKVFSDTITTYLRSFDK